MYQLDAGSTYELEFFNYHPQPVTQPSRFTITPSNDVITALGWSGFEVASRYDRPTVTFLIFGMSAVLLGALMQVVGRVVPGISGAVQNAFRGSPPPGASQQPASGGRAP